MNPYFEIIRPINSVMAAVAVLIGAMVASGDLFTTSTLFGFAVAFIAASARFIIN